MGATPSFELYARAATRGDVHRRVVLDELVRLGMVTESEGKAELTAEAFVPTKDDKVLLAFVADNGHDHLLAAVGNLLTRQPLFLERSIFAKDMSLQACENIQDSMRKDWANHNRLMDSLTEDDRRPAIRCHASDTSRDLCLFRIPAPDRTHPSGQQKTARKSSCLTAASRIFLWLNASSCRFF